MEYATDCIQRALLLFCLEENIGFQTGILLNFGTDKYRRINMFWA